MNWDDLRFVLALSKAGSLARAAKGLGVDHTTVGRRIGALEAALGVRLFTRTPQGYVPTADALSLAGPMKQVEEAVRAVERGAARDELEGTIRVTSPETLGVSYLAPRLAQFSVQNPRTTIELLPCGEVLDLGNRDAEIAVRTFRSTQGSLAMRRVAEVTYGLYASVGYLERRPVRSALELADHPLLTSATEPQSLEGRWLRRLSRSLHMTFVSPFSLAVLGAAKASAGIAILPRYVGDADAALRHIPMPDEPTEPLWLTVHRDLKATRRVRVVLDYLAAAMKADAALFRGRRAG